MSNQQPQQKALTWGLAQRPGSSRSGSSRSRFAARSSPLSSAAASSPPRGSHERAVMFPNLRLPHHLP